MQLSEAVLIALLTSGLTFLAAMLVQRPRSIAEAQKLNAEKEALSNKSDLETIKALTDQLSEARVSITRYRRRLREHRIDPDSDTGPLGSIGGSA